LETDQYGQVVVVGPTQDGKTWVTDVVPWLYHVVERREAVAVVMPTQAKITSLWQTKILPAIHGNGLSHELPLRGGGSEGGTPAVIHLASGGISHQLSTGTSNEAGLSSVTVRVVLADEVDDIAPARRLDLAWARADAWGLEARRCESSTIKHDGPGASRVLRDYAAGTAGRLHFACAHCSAWQIYEWDRVTYDPQDDATAFASARLVCGVNGCLMTEADRRRSLLRHRLVFRDQSVAADGTVVGDRPVTRIWSLRWTALDSPLKSLGELAQRHLRALRARDTDGDHERLRQFVRDQLTQGYQQDQQQEDAVPKLTAAFLAARSHGHGWAVAVHQQEAHKTWSRHVAPMPDAARRCAIAVDVQGNRLYWLLTAEDDDRRTYDVAWGYEFADPQQSSFTEATLHDVLDRVDALVDDLADHALVVGRGVDVGFSAQWIIPWLARRPAWVPVAGAADDTLRGAKKAAARSIPGVVHLFRPASDWRLNRLLHAVDVQHLRERVQGRYLVPAGRTGCAYLPRGCEVNRGLCRHYVAEELVTTASGARVWRQAKGGGRHDWMDCRVYNEALLELKRLTMPTVTAEDPPDHAVASGPRRPSWLQGY
jgi:phage terminase large subunit GpA-like protein